MIFEQRLGRANCATIWKQRPYEAPGMEESVAGEYQGVGGALVHAIIKQEHGETCGSRQ